MKHRAHAFSEPEGFAPKALPVSSGAAPEATGVSDAAAMAMRAIRGRAPLVTLPSAPPVTDPFAPAIPPAGVLPAGMTPKMAMDDIAGFSGALAYAASGSWIEQYGFLGFQYLAQLAQRPEFRRISEVMAEEQTRKWIRVLSASEESKSKAVKGTGDAMKRFRVRERFFHATLLDGLFGRGQIYIDTGQDDDPGELETPLIPDKAKLAKGGLKRLTVVEPMWTYPGPYNASDPLKPRFYEPDSWYVLGRKIHRSRLLTIVSREVPDILKPAYAFAGLSLSQMAKPYVDNFLRTRQSVSDMIHAYSVWVLSTDMGQVLQGGGVQSLINRVQLFNLARDNGGMAVFNKDTEDVSNISAPLGGLHELQAQSQEQIASVVGIPLVKLLGISPSGLNASSDGEIRMFYDGVIARSERVLGDPIQALLSLIQVNEFGEVDPDVTTAFEPLWQLDEAGRAQVFLATTQAATLLIEAGVLHPEEERRRLATQEDTPYPGLDVEDVPTREDLAELGLADSPSEEGGGGGLGESKGEERSGV